MPIRKHLDAFMAKLGYVRSPAKMAASTIPLTIEVDSSQVREALPLLEQTTAAALAAEGALAKLLNTQLALRNELPCPGPCGAAGIISKSVLEDEMKRRGVLRDTPPDKL